MNWPSLRNGALAALLLFLFVLGALPAARAAVPGYAGSASCAACHPAQTSAWRGSHHAQAMQPATPQTVLGDFSGVGVEHHGQRTRFFRRDARHWVRTAGADGREADFEITHTFGVYPLQQYLIALPGGRLQALGVAWDARPREAGGQRWFHVYGDAPPAPGESTHWSGRDQTWNFMCASCHSTGVRKNYDAAADQYRTEAAEHGVGCEACHGPGSGHLRWAQQGDSRRDPLRGFGAPLSTLKPPAFAFQTPGQPIAAATAPVGAGQAASEVCYGCHARRQELRADPDPRAPFLDNYLPLLLEDGEFHADGRIQGEVFEYAAFQQSAMHRAGVTCSHCHDSHSGRLRAAGNALCSGCHQPARYDAPAHHRHASASPGAACVSCHMPTRTYMGVHARHDHGLRRPATGGGEPAACLACHGDKSADWLGATLAAWRHPAGAAASQAGSAGAAAPAGRRPAAGSRTAAAGPAGTGAAAAGDSATGAAAPERIAAEFAAAWQAARDGLPTPPMPAALSSPAGVVRGSALAALPADVLLALPAALADRDPLVRLGAARALAGLPPRDAARLGAPLLADPRRAVRVEAARSLAGLPPELWDAASARHLDAALGELVAAEQLAADRPQAHLNLARLQLRRGQPREAEQALRQALRLDPAFLPATLNLADLYRQLRREEEAEALLRQAAARTPAAAPAHALGLLLVRRSRLGEALPWLERAARAEPRHAGYGLAWALALQQTGDSRRALQVLDALLGFHPADAALRRARQGIAPGA